MPPTKTSTPNGSRERNLTSNPSPDVSIIDTCDQSPILITHDSSDDLQEALTEQCTSRSEDAARGRPASLCELGRPDSPCELGRKHVCIQVPESVDDYGVLERMKRFFFSDKAECSAFKLETLEHAGGGKSARAHETLSETTTSSIKCCPTKKKEPKHVSFGTDPEESVCRSSLADSPSSSCASARAHYYQNKLLSTLQVLQNKEETVRVQAESLSVAEARIASLTTRGAELKREIERKGLELQCLRKALEETRIEKCDASITAHMQEMEDKENIVTLQTNLSVIEDLYRECFYETVKQDNLVEMLRKSYLDVRLMEKEKSDQISKLHNVINTQKWSLDKCQDIATEVDNLKMEISNFLSSSNNDSGMWEESVAGGVCDDLQDIATQLLRLRDLLTGDCTCGLLEENKRLKEANDEMDKNIGDLQSRISHLEANLIKKDTLEELNQEEIETKERELHCIREKLMSMEQETQEKSTCCDKLALQITQTQMQLSDKSSELLTMQKHSKALEDTIKSMTENLATVEQLNNENLALRRELYTASRRAARLQRRGAALEQEAARARARAEHVEACYREKAHSAVQLAAQLDAAHGRGAELCAEARRAVAAVRGWARHVRDLHREQEEQLEYKEFELRSLQQQIEKRQNALNSRLCQTNTPPCGERQRHTPVPCASEMEATCSNYLTQTNAGSFTSAGPCLREGRGIGVGECASEIASCSTPVPPKRMLKHLKQKWLPPSPCTAVLRRYGLWGGPPQRDAAVQRPNRRDAAVAARAPGAVARCVRCHTAPPGAPPAPLPCTLRDTISPCPRPETSSPPCIRRDSTPSCSRLVATPPPCAARDEVPQRMWRESRDTMSRSVERDGARVAPPSRCAGCGNTLQCVCSNVPHNREPLPASPGEEIFARMESISEALSDAYRRWSGGRPRGQSRGRPEDQHCC